MDKQLKDPPVTADEAEQVCAMSVGFCTVADWWGNEDESLRFYGMVHLFNQILHILMLIEWTKLNADTKDSCNILSRIGNN